MKKLILILLLSFSSCNSSDANKQEDSILGTWNLLKYEPGFSPIENFNESEITWEFQQNGIVNIIIDNSISSVPISPNGSYTYSLNGEKILIDDMQYDYEFKNNLLIISDNPSADGFRAEFSKSQPE